MTRQEEILTLFQSDARQALALMIEEYSPLLWTVAAERLTDPEDIRECVNDTFAGFWQMRTRFDPDKGTLANYLAAIARRRAVSMYRKNQRRAAHELHASADDMTELSGVRPAADTASRSADAFETAENHLLLEGTLAALKPEDADIIRMKYYGGMTVQEIADSLSLPYETVKKRHQRSLSKMRRILLAVLIVALIALLTACAYMVLRHFRLIPGYGVTDETDVSIYCLKESAISEGKYAQYQIKNAFYAEGQLYLQLVITCRDEEAYRTLSAYKNSTNESLLLYDNTGDPVAALSLFQIDPLTWETETLRLVEVSLPDTDDEIELRLSGYDVNLSFSLVPAEKEIVDGYDSVLTDEGGLIAIPSFQDGELTVFIYLLDTGDKEIVPYLIYDDELKGNTDDITLISADGDVVAGELLPLYYSGSLSLTEWNFGKISPGTYTLHIPYLYFRTTLSETFTFHLNLEQNTYDQDVCELPYGSLSITGLEPIYPEPGTFYRNNMTATMPLTDYWLLKLHLEPKGDWMYSGTNLLAPEYTRINAEQSVTRIISDFSLWPDTENDYELMIGFGENCVDLTDIQLVLKEGTQVNVRWMHSFDITFTLESAD